MSHLAGRSAEFIPPGNPGKKIRKFGPTEIDRIDERPDGDARQEMSDNPSPLTYTSENLVFFH